MRIFLFFIFSLLVSGCNFNTTISRVDSGSSNTPIAADNPRLDLSSGAAVNVLTDKGSKMQIRLGDPMAAPTQVTSGGYKVQFQTE